MTLRSSTGFTQQRRCSLCGHGAVTWLTERSEGWLAAVNDSHWQDAHTSEPLLVRVGQFIDIGERPDCRIAALTVKTKTYSSLWIGLAQRNGLLRVALTKWREEHVAVASAKRLAPKRWQRAAALLVYAPSTLPRL